MRTERLTIIEVWFVGSNFDATRQDVTARFFNGLYAARNRAATDHLK